jgi:hypothetical protein
MRRLESNPAGARGRWKKGGPFEPPCSYHAFAKRLSLIFFALFFLGFLALVGFAYLVSSAVNHSELLPAVIAVSV